MSDVDADDLATLDLLGECSRPELAELAAHLDVVEVRPDELLMREGERATTFFLLAAGRVVADVGGHVVGEAAVGSILGELALLRGSTRTATVRARSQVRAFVGDTATFELLVGLPGVGDRVELAARHRLAVDLPPLAIELSDGSPLVIRPITPDDRTRVREAAAGFSDSSRYSRFHGFPQLDDRLLSFLTEVDYVTSFVWIVLDKGRPGNPAIAGARYTRLEGDTDTAETGFSILDDYQGRGLGRLLLGLLAVAARAHGITRLQADVLETNAAMRAVLDSVQAEWARSEVGSAVATVDVATACSLAGGEATAAAAHELAHQVSISSRLLLAAADSSAGSLTSNVVGDHR